MFESSPVLETEKLNGKKKQVRKTIQTGPLRHTVPFPSNQTFTVLVQPREHVHKSVLFTIQRQTKTKTKQTQTKRASLNTTEVSGKSHSFVRSRQNPAVFLKSQSPNSHGTVATFRMTITNVTGPTNPGWE